MEGPFATWGTDTGGFLRPLSVLSLALDYHIWGLRPTGYHISNLLLHIVCSFGVLRLTELLFRFRRLPEAGTAGLMAGAVFLLLPSHSEPLCWISARSDLLAACFAVFSLAAFLRMTTGGSRKWAAAALLFYALGLASKESVVPMPLVWLAAVLPLSEKRHLRRCLAAVLGGGLVLSVYLLIRWTLLGSFIGGLGTARHMGLADIGILKNLLRYCLRVFSPPLDVSWAAAGCLLALAGLGAALAVRSAGRRLSTELRLTISCAVCFLVLLLPVLSLRIGVMDSQSERYLYLPGVFACVGIVSASRAALGNGRRQFRIMAALIAVFAVGLYLSNRRWSRAGELSRRLSLQAAGLRAESSVIVNLPDNYRGAYVFRNGLEQAVTIFRGGSGAPPVLHLHPVLSGEEYSAAAMDDSLLLELPDTTLLFPGRDGVRYQYFDGRALVPVKNR